MAKKRIAGITIELDADVTGLVKSLDKVSRQVDGLGQSLQKVGKNLTTHLTVPIVAAGTAAVKNFAEVDKTMVLTNKTMGNTAEEAELLNKAMGEAASNSIFGMNDAATATLNFARAGLSAEEAAAALAPAMNLAAGEGGDLDTVSAGLVATLNGFGDTFDNASTYADVFANACNNSALDVNSLSDSMSIAAPVFSAAGYTVEDAALYMGIMANAGIEASEGANALKTGLSRLISPTKDAQGWINALGIEVTNADGTMKDTITVQQELHDSFATLSESEQIAAASAIFGKNQMAKWLALINTSPEEVQALSTSIGEVGTVTEMSDAMMNGFGGSIEKLKSTVDVLMYTLGGLIAQYLTPVIEKIQGAVDAFMALDDETKEHIIQVAAVVAAIGPVLLIIGKLVSGIGTIISVASSLIAIIGAISAPVLVVIGVITALIAIGVLLYKNWDEIKLRAEMMGKAIVLTWEFLKNKTSEIWNNIKTATVDKVTGMIDNVKQRIEVLKLAFTMTFDAIKDKVRSAIDYIKGLFNFHWSLPDIRLPHFSVSGQFSLNPPQIPHFSVQWYKKAMNSAFMLNDATIFGARGNTLLGGGEAGSEMIIGANKLMNMIAQAKGGETVITNTFNINGTDRDPSELAQEISYYLDMELHRTERAFA